jgi:Flp pilus assembly protein protease CpaA
VLTAILLFMALVLCGAVYVVVIQERRDEKRRLIAASPWMQAPHRQ